MAQKRLFLLLTAAALLLAAAAWGAVGLRRLALGSGERCALVRGTLEDALPLSGVVLRQETPLPAPVGGIRLLAGEGERLPAGTPLAIVYESGEDYFAASLLLALRSRQRRTADPGPDARGDYAAALARRDFASLALAARGLGAGLGLEDPSAEHLAEEIAALAPLGERGILSAEAAGFFSRQTDGWEDVDPRKLTPAAFRSRLAAEPSPAGPGRLTDGSEWSFAALVSGPAAARFSPGEELALRLPSGTELRVRVGSAVTEGADTLITLRCREHLGEVLSLRRAEMTVIFDRFEGLILPAAALREEEEGCYVRRADASPGGKTPVTVLFRRGALAVVRSELLREGMQVIVGP